MAETKPGPLLENVTALVLAHNERENIGRSLESLSFVPQLIVLDSGSTDETIAIANGYPNTKVVQHPFTSFAAQCEFGHSLIDTEWVLSLDADYLVTPELKTEIQNLRDENQINGYQATFDYCVFGRALRTSIYPPRCILYRKNLSRYKDEGHGHKVVVQGRIVPLRAHIQHDDRKPLGRWIDSQDCYARIEAKNLTSSESKDLALQDVLRKWVVPAPIIMFFYLLFVRGLILDGWRGWFYVAQRMVAELMLSLRLIELKLAGANSHQAAGS